METVTLKLERRHVEWLRARARGARQSQAAVVRDLIERHLGPGERPSLHDRARDLCGAITGDPNLSVRPLKGYGRD